MARAPTTAPGIDPSPPSGLPVAATWLFDRGELGATVESNPRYGPLAFETIAKLRKGEKIPTKILVNDRFFDKANARQFIAEAY